jgi:ABC-2 type transport system permease protein
MEATVRSTGRFTARTVREVFSFFFFLGRRTGKSRMFFLLGILPVVLSIVVKITVNPRADDVMTVFIEILMVFFLQFYIVILSLFYGSSVLAEEVEGRTLPYLVTRPLSKPGIIIGKTAAYVWLMFLMVAANLFLSFFIININDLANPSLYTAFLSYLGVLFLGIVAYTSLFVLLGVFMKRAILFGLAFGFGWENVIQFFPGSTQKFSIVHYLKSLLPYRSPTGGSRLMILLFRLEPSSPAASILTLIVVSAVFLGLACVLFRWKEYLFEE